MDKRHIGIRTSIVAVLVLGLAGCSIGSVSGEIDASSSEQVKGLGQRLADQGFLEQAAAMEDGVVSADEYVEAQRLVSQCLRDRGYLVSEPVLSPLTNTNLEFFYDARGLDQEAAVADIDECELRYWIDISAVYVDTAPQHMDEVLRSAIADCIELAGFEVKDDQTTLSKLRGGGDDRKQVVDTCATDETFRLYPELKSLNLPGEP